MTNFRGTPNYQTNNTEWNRKTSKVLNAVLRGKLNNTGSITLTANSATTTITFPEGVLGTSSELSLMPKTANAAAALSGLYESSRNVLNGTLTLTHANNAQSDKTYGYSIHG